MKLFKYIVTACLVIVSVMTSVAQSDPGISRHNYKHANKAKLAKSTTQEGVEIRTFDYKTVAQYQAARRSNGASVTPKYAPRYSSVVVPVKSIDRTNENNPLKNPSNYKARHTDVTTTSTDLMATID